MTDCVENIIPANTDIDQYGNHRWYNFDRKLHREDGPASISRTGSQLWYVNGTIHRIDGPAYIGSDGTQEWYVNGFRQHSTKEFQQAAKLTDEEMIVLILKYGNITFVPEVE